MSESIMSSVTLRDYTVLSGQSPEQVSKLLRSFIDHATTAQNRMIKWNKNKPTAERSGTIERAKHFKLFRCAALPKHVQARSRVQWMYQAETHRLVSSWQERDRIAKLLEKHDWELPYAERPEECRYVKRNLWENISRSRARPALPLVRNARLDTSVTCKQLFSLEWSPEGRITLRDFRLWGEIVTMEFRIPEKLLRLHRNIVKVSRPIIRLDKNDRVCFDFTLMETVTMRAVSGDTVIGVDPGVRHSFTASRVTRLGDYSSAPVRKSVFTERHAVRLTSQVFELRKTQGRNKRRESLGVRNANALAQQLILREKVNAKRVAEDWSMANDLVTLALSDSDAYLALEHITWLASPREDFRATSRREKIVHVARRAGVITSLVPAAYSSRECPACRARLSLPGRDRLVSCACGWVADRDHSASLVLALRGLESSARARRSRDRKRVKLARAGARLSRESVGRGERVVLRKGVPTASRPPARGRVMERRLRESLARKLVSGFPFTGGEPLLATEESTALLATTMDDNKVYHSLTTRDKTSRDSSLDNSS